MPSLSDFLLRNVIPTADGLPLVHTTSAYTLSKILRKKQIVPRKCDVFTPDTLSYFFVGRPSYKRDFDQEGEYWQLPSCVVLDYDSVEVKRLFPFDTGAFKKAMLPDYITMMELDEFTLLPSIESAKKLIGAFFVNPSRYYRMQPRTKLDFERRFDIDTLDQEVRALYNLILSKSAKYDDRRFAIEIQTEQIVTLSKSNVLAVVFPEEYLESDEYMGWVERDLEAEPLPYQTFPLNPEFYYHAMYEKIHAFFQNDGYLR